MPTYQQAVSALYALGHELGKPRKFDLANMAVLATALGNPQRRFPAVLIAGTNGKGSTSATLASITRAAGYRTGLYTSPHLVNINERIQIDGEPIADSEVAEMYDRVADCARRLVREGTLPQSPSFFEMLTAMAFEYFASSRIDIAILEVGMGGRLDATNISDPCVSVITDIALDHQQYLGNTIAEIAAEKAGIIRNNGLLVTLPQHPEANDAIGRIAIERNAHAVSAAQYVPNVTPGAARFDNLRPAATQIGQFFRTRYFLDVMGQEVLIETPLIGRHQLRNTALAIAAAEQLNPCGFTISAQNIADGIRETYWPGRFQLIPGSGAPSIPAPGAPSIPAVGAPPLSASFANQVGTPSDSTHNPPPGAPSIPAVGAPPLSPSFGDRVGTSSDSTHHTAPGAPPIPRNHAGWVGPHDIILDVAHNPAGAWALRSSLSENFEDRPLTIIFGAMRDKAIAEMAQILFPLADHVIATQADNPRAATPEDIRDLAAPFAEVTTASTVAAAIERARSITPANGVIVITGSIYVVGEAFARLSSTASASTLSS